MRAKSAYEEEKNRIDMTVILTKWLSFLNPSYISLLLPRMAMVYIFFRLYYKTELYQFDRLEILKSLLQLQLLPLVAMFVQFMLLSIIVN